MKEERVGIIRKMVSMVMMIKKNIFAIRINTELKFIIAKQFLKITNYKKQIA
jgi:hypothetical protein